MDLFADIWQTQKPPTRRVGPLIPSTHVIRDPRKAYFIKREISRLWKLEHTRARNPAPQPVSIMRADLAKLQRHRYAVAEKTDGVRYLLLLSRWPHALGGQPFAVLCSRKYDFYEIRVMAEEDYFRGSLIDGEMVWEYEGGQFTPPRHVFLGFDVVALKGMSYVQEPYLRRYSRLSEILDCGAEDITRDPRKWSETAMALAEQHRIVSEGNQYCLCFRAKCILMKQEVGTVWRTQKSLRHKSDGLIFTPIDEGIQTGTHRTMFKWKPQPTIDVRCVSTFDAVARQWNHVVSYGDGGRPCTGDVDGVYLDRPPELTNISDQLYPYEEVPLLIVPSDYWQTVIDWHHRRGETEFTHIVECSCQLPALTEWFASATTIPMVECTVIKIRADKAEPNQKATIEATLRNIRENISIRDLVDACTAQISPATE